MLENVQRGANVTVIHLSDPSTIDKHHRKQRNNATLQSMNSQGSRFSSRRRRKGFRCADCARKLNEKHRRKSARYCTRCSSKDDCLVRGFMGDILKFLSEYELILIIDLLF
ncbi:unnamed protein product [Anisakis simplex]|uniref:Zn(2)-C6 fungal-type domain-containing protein n=1 Tax=Anisakis simplex TaxID=6269 RepID=A0A0M3JPN2_ANISI|nr:unnamed protein product [Anisakis simplex]